MHAIQISLPPSPAGLAPELPASMETRRFLVAQRRGMLCIVASPDGRDGSLQIQSDARVYSAILDSGRHLAYEVAPQSSVWLHIVTGKVRMGSHSLSAGDGAGIAGQHAVSLIAQDDSEILLVGLAEPHAGSASNGFEP